MNEREMIDVFEKIAQFELPEAAVERDLERVRNVLAHGESKTSIWRTISRSRWTKLAAAAVVLIVAGVAVKVFLQPAPAAAELLAQVARNMENLAWVKTTTERYVPDKEEPVAVDVHWTDVKGRRVFAIYEQKYIHLMDYVRWQWSIYRPETNDVIISPLEGQWVSPAGEIQTYVEKLRDEGLEVTQSETVHQGRKAMVVTFIESLNDIGPDGSMTNMLMGGKHVKTIERRIVIDKQDRLLGASETTYRDREGRIIAVYRSTSEPLETGPADIHELGVPKDATIINKVPEERVMKTREAIAGHASAFLDDYIAVITEARVEDGQERIIEAMVVFCHNRMLRVDVYLRLYGFPGPVTSRHEEVLSASLSVLKSYWPDETERGIRSVRLYDGLWQYVLDVQDDKLTARDRQRRPDGDMYADDDIADLAWPRLWWLNEPEHMFEDDYSREHGLIAMELAPQWQGYLMPRRQVMYVDPGKDYICHRYTDEELFDAPWQEDRNWMDKVEKKDRLTETVKVREVTEYGRTSTGQWYPRVITETGYRRPYGRRREDIHTIIRIHLLAEHPDFPADIFDPARLPQPSSSDNSP